MDFDIYTVGLRSPISALQVGIVENVKFNHEFSLFFAQILLKNDTVQYRTTAFIRYVFLFYEKISISILLGTLKYRK